MGNRATTTLGTENLTEDLETIRKRALYRATHRGTMEMDWLLGRFAEAHLKDIDRGTSCLF